MLFSRSNAEHDHASILCGTDQGKDTSYYVIQEIRDLDPKDRRGLPEINDEDHLSGPLTSCTPLFSTSSNFHRGGL